MAGCPQRKDPQVSLKKHWIWLQSQKAEGERHCKIAGQLMGAGERRGVPVPGEQPALGRTDWERGAGLVEGNYGSNVVGWGALGV